MEKEKEKMWPEKDAEIQKDKDRSSVNSVAVMHFGCLDFVTVRKRKIFMLEGSPAECMNSRCSVSWQTVENGFSRRCTTLIKEKHGLKRKT